MFKCNPEVFDEYNSWNENWHAWSWFRNLRNERRCCWLHWFWLCLGGTVQTYLYFFVKALQCRHMSFMLSQITRKTLNLLKIEDIMKTKALKLYYRYKQNELPKYFESMFTESNDNHSHDTRHKSLLYQLPTKTCTGRLCIRLYIPELLSKTPECITEKLDTHSFSGFSNYMKNYYIRNYNENCLIENCYICQK